MKLSNYFWPLAFILFGTFAGIYTGKQKKQAYKDGIYHGFAAGIDTTQKILDFAKYSVLDSTAHCITYNDTIIHCLIPKPEFIEKIYENRDYYKRKHPRID